VGDSGLVPPQPAAFASDVAKRAVELFGDGPVGVLRVLESMSVAFFHLDALWRFGYLNAEAERVLGFGRTELLGRVIWEAFPAAVGSDFERFSRGAVESAEPTMFETFYPEPLNGWYEVRAFPSPEGLAVYFLDVTARKTAQLQVDAALSRFALLSQVSAELSGTLDADEAVGRLARVVVPALADWAIVTIVDDRPSRVAGTARDVGTWHADPRQRKHVARYAQLRARASGRYSTVARTLAAGENILAGEELREVIRRIVAGEPDAEAALGALAPEVVGYFPLRGRGRIGGVLTLCRGAERGPFSDEELATAREVGVRAGLALDNARLFAEQRALSEGLQRSLLTEPPAPDHMEIVVRYVPAAEAAQVGGDWYDAFLQPAGATMVVIGDVIGHDTAAAAAMGQLRAALRAIAVSSGDGPADLLCRVDQALQTLQVDTTASVVVARFEQTDDERAQGVSRMRWSNAGHPPPMVIGPDGSVLALTSSDADLLLGVAADSARNESVFGLDRGSTVLLYTDGLVERRGQSLDEGLTRLQHVLAELAFRPLNALCDAVLSQLLPEHPEDDVAIVAIRLHRQDRERPIDAGPVRIPPTVPQDGD
jgi:serine phosphatase RsbU (regulator of sigma subunit)/PAS domain-containing protein